MIYLIAIPLIVGTTTYIGFTYSNKLQKRTQQIRYLISALQILESEIIFGLSPLKEAFEKVSRQVPEPISSFLFEVSGLIAIHNDIRISIEMAFASNEKNLTFDKEEKDVLLQLASSLGKYDLSSQQLHIRSALTSLERIEIESEEIFAKYGKLARYLGMLSGLLIVILFL